MGYVPVAWGVIGCQVFGQTVSGDRQYRQTVSGERVTDSTNGELNGCTSGDQGWADGLADGRWAIGRDWQMGDERVWSSVRAWVVNIQVG